MSALSGIIWLGGLVLCQPVVAQARSSEQFLSLAVGLEGQDHDAGTHDIAQDNWAKLLADSAMGAKKEEEIGSPPAPAPAPALAPAPTAAARAPAPAAVAPAPTPAAPAAQEGASDLKAACDNNGDEVMLSIASKALSESWVKMPAVAVVGSSGKLLHSQAGAEIDSHGIVIRCNAAPTIGFEMDVGRVVTFVAGSGTGLIDATQAKIRPQGVVQIPYEEHLVKPPDPDGLPAPHIHLSLDWVRRLHSNELQGQGHWPSAGFVALQTGMVLAQHLKLPLHVYGYGPNACNKYYDCKASNLFAPDNNYHPVERERQYMQQMAQQGKLTLH